MDAVAGQNALKLILVIYESSFSRPPTSDEEIVTMDVNVILEDAMPDEL